MGAFWRPWSPPERLCRCSLARFFIGKLQLSSARGPACLLPSGNAGSVRHSNLKMRSCSPDTTSAGMSYICATAQMCADFSATAASIGQSFTSNHERFQGHWPISRLACRLLDFGWSTKTAVRPGRLSQRWLKLSHGQPDATSPRQLGAVVATPVEDGARIPVSGRRSENRCRAEQRSSAPNPP